MVGCHCPAFDLQQSPYQDAVRDYGSLDRTDGNIPSRTTIQNYIGEHRESNLS
jgi:hypothetical protein